jgi:signal transduction histidine kinase
MEKNEVKIGEFGYVNKNCWLARTVGYPPSKRCQYCESKFPNCLFFRYLIITSVIIICILATSVLMNETISRLLIISVFALVIVYGYFFSKSTEDIIVANFAQRKAVVAKEELEKIDEVKNQFMAIANHHLRTPLTAVGWYIDLLMSGKYGKIPKKINDIIGKIRASTADEVKIVNDLLNVSQFQLGKEVVRAKEKVDIEKMFAQIMEDEVLEVKQKGIYLKLEKQKDIPMIPADESKLKVALENIVDNAVKYTEKGGVTIKLKSDSEKLEIIIQDTGIGMKEPGSKSIFAKTFERGETAQKLFAVGKGIGLYLSAKIVEAHKGKIWAESEGENKGSAFHIELPVKL